VFRPSCVLNAIVFAADMQPDQSRNLMLFRYFSFVSPGIHDYIKKGIEGLKMREIMVLETRVTDEDREIILSALFNDPHLFGYLRNTWSLRSLAKCLTNELGLLSCTVIIAIRACAHFHCLCFSIHCSYILSNSSTSASFSENVTITANFLFLLS